MSVQIGDNYMADSQSIYSQNPTNPITSIFDLKMFPFSSGQVNTMQNNSQIKCVPITDAIIQNSYLKLENIKLLNANDFLVQENAKLRLKRDILPSQKSPLIGEEKYIIIKNINSNFQMKFLYDY